MQSWAYTLVMVVSAFGYHKAPSTDLLQNLHGRRKEKGNGMKTLILFLSTSFLFSLDTCHAGYASTAFLHTGTILAKRIIIG